MDMCSSWRWASVTAAMLTGVPSLLGAVRLDLTDTYGATGSFVPYLAGQEVDFQVHLRISGNEEVTGYTFFLLSDVPGAWRIVGRTNGSAVITEFLTSNSVLTHSAFNVLNPVNGADIGARAPDANPPGMGAVSAPGENSIQIITLYAQQDLCCGDLWITDASWYDRSGQQHLFDGLGIYIIGIPEPGYGWLLALAWLVPLWRGRYGTGGQRRRRLVRT
jgi:hypothetical protein